MFGIRTYYFLIQNSEIQELVDKYDLPYRDGAYFNNVELTNQYLTKEETKDFDSKMKYVLSLNHINQIVVDADKDDRNDLRQIGVYKYNLSGAGFNSDNRSKFVGVWIKKSTKDTLYIYEDFTWKRKKQINETLYYLWEGEYTFAENIVIFSL